MIEPDTHTLRFAYTNYRGETAVRTATPRRLWWGKTAHHPDAQWFVTAFDHDKQQDRDFALADCDFSISDLQT